MVQFRAIDKRVASADLIRQFNENVNGLKDIVLKDMAADIAQRSPVDTGTYASSHRVGQRSGSFKASKSSHGKPESASPASDRDAGLSRMISDIDGLPDGAQNIVFRNEAEHALYVETRGWNGKGPYQVYTAVRNRFNVIVGDAKARLGMR